MGTQLKIRTNSASRRRIAATIAVLLVVGVASAAYLYFMKKDSATQSSTSTSRPRNTIDYSPAKPEDKIGESSKDQTAKNESQPATNTTPTPLTVNISNASQDAEAPYTVHVRAFTPSQVNGTCTVAFTHDTATITKSAALNIQAGYAICQGFDVPRSEFVSSGTWKVHVNVTTTSTSGSADATMEVK